MLGIDGTSLVFLVVDGRSTLHSRGTTLEETRAPARRLGLVTALNLDGGGSTQLVWKGVTVNRPSDGRERPALRPPGGAPVELQGAPRPEGPDGVGELHPLPVEEPLQLQAVPAPHLPSAAPEGF